MKEDIWFLSGTERRPGDWSMMSEQWKGMRRGMEQGDTKVERCGIGLSWSRGHGLALLVHDDNKK